MPRRLSEVVQEVEDVSWDWSLVPAQEGFFTTQAFESMYSGAFGTGKTRVLCARVLANLLYVPKNLGFLCRMDGKALRHSTMQMLYEMLDPNWIAQKNEQQGFIRLKQEYGGSRLIFGDLKDLNDLKNLPLGFAAVEQAEEIEETHWDFLLGRLRRKNFFLHPETNERMYHVRGLHNQKYCRKNVEGDRHVAVGSEATHCAICHSSLVPFNEKYIDGERPWDVQVYPNFMFGVCNPEGPNHWIYRRFPGMPGAKGHMSEGDTSGRTAGFTATTYEARDAGYVTVEWVDDIERRYKEVPLMYDRYMLGLWVEAEGLVYPGFSREHSVIEIGAKRHDGSPMLNSEWPAWEYIDHGTTSPTAVGWVLVENCACGCEKSNFWVVDEHYEDGKTVMHHAQMIKSHRTRLPNPLQATLLDSAAFSKMFSKEDELWAVSDEYIEHGIYVMRNQKNWDAGYQRMTDLFTKDPNHIHPVTGVAGAPHLYVLSICPKWTHEIENYKWKKVRPGQSASEEPEDRNDHHMDGFNGFILGRPEAAIHKQDDESKEPEWVKQFESMFGESHTGTTYMSA